MRTTPSALSYWLLAICLIGCSTGRPAINRKISGRTLAIPTPGGGTQPLTTRAIEPKEPTFKASAARLVILPWKYGNLTASNYWWNIEVSTDLRTWTTLVTNASGPHDVTATNKQEFFRLKGRP